MPEFLDLNRLPEYSHSSFRYFEKHEKHITRVCMQDVLVMIFDGTLRFYENGVPVEVPKGSFYIQKKGIPYDGVVESDEPQYYYIHFLGNFNMDDGLPISGPADFTELFPLFRELDRARFTKASRVEINGAFYSILSSLKKGAQRPEKNAVAAKIVSYATEDISRPLSLDLIAAKAGYCKNQVINLFKQETGMTPHAYITHIRLDTASRLLVSTDMSVEKISSECGFGSYVNFYKAFIKKYKLSPLDWREKHMGE